MIAPTLHTDRLRLRPLEVRDFDAYADMFASNRDQFMGKLDRLQAWYCFGADVASWPIFGFGHWAIDCGQAFVGQIRFQNPVNYPETEFGWLLFDGFEGQGYATEAAKAALTWAGTNIPLDSIVSYIDVENHASIALAERLGAVLDRDAQRPDGETAAETHVYRHDIRGAA